MAEKEKKWIIGGSTEQKYFHKGEELHVTAVSPGAYMHPHYSLQRHGFVRQLVSLLQRSFPYIFAIVFMFELLTLFYFAEKNF
jgi:hypothetical protein